MRRSSGVSHWVAGIALMVVLAGATRMPATSSLFVQDALGQVASGATLSVLAPSVDVATAGGAFTTARDGMIVSAGDQIRTANGGVALLTFFDGSQTQLTPDTQVQIQQAVNSNGPQINISQIVGTTVDHVQRLGANSGTFSTDSPAAAALVRGTRYTVTTKCYAIPPPTTPPANRLLTFPRRVSGTSDLLAAEAVYDDNGTLWEDRAWQDPNTGDAFDTYEAVGAAYPEISETIYQEGTGEYWVDREWQDPSTGATWDTYEDVGVPADDQQAASLPPISLAELPITLAQAQGNCHPEMSVVVIEGIVGLQPKTAALAALNVSPGNAGVASDAATANSGLTPQGQQAFDQATSNLRDVNAARTAGQLGGQVADEFAAVVVPQPAGAPGGGGGGGGGAGGGPGPGAGPPGAVSPSGLLGATVVLSATADSGLQAQVATPVAATPVPVTVAGAQASPQQAVAQLPGTNGNQPPAGGVAGGVLPPQPSSPPRGGGGGGAGGGGAPAPNPNLAQGVIGPGGGSVQLPDGSAVVTLPPGDVNQNTTVQIARTTPPQTSNGQQVVSSAVDLTASNASGAVKQFQQPVQVTLAFSGGTPAGVFFFDPNTSTWEPVDGGSTVNSNGTVTGNTSHFTIFAALTAPNTPTPTPTPSATVTATPSATPTATPTIQSSCPTANAPELQIPLPNDPGDPVDIAVNPNTCTIYVTGGDDAVANTVYVVDGRSNVVTDTIVLSGANRVTMLAVNPTTNRIYATSQLANKVFVIDGATDRVVATINGFEEPVGLDLNPNTNLLYVANFGLDLGSPNTVAVVDLTTNTITRTIGVGPDPFGVAVNPATNKVYVTNQGACSSTSPACGRTVSVIDGATNAVTATITVGTKPFLVSVNPVTDTIYVANDLDNTVSVINGATSTVSATIPGFALPFGVAVNTVTNTAYVTNSAMTADQQPGINNSVINTVAVIDGSTNTIRATLPVCQDPFGTAVNPNNNTLYVVTHGSRTVSVIPNPGANQIPTPACGPTPTPTPAASWSQLTPGGTLPSTRAMHSSVLDTATGRMIVFGGRLTPSSGNPNSGNLNDVWRLSGLGTASQNWLQVAPSGTAPAPRQGHSAVYDSGSNRMIVFGGGEGASSPCENDVWVLTNANGNGGAPAWIQLATAGGPPPARMQHGAAYDASTNTMIVFGGQDCFHTLFDDVWVLSNANGIGGIPTWSQLHPTGTGPCAREIRGGVTYDPTNNRLIVFGGAGTSGQCALNDTWVLTNANGRGGTPAWTQLSPSGSLPPGRAENSSIYDPGQNRLTIFGGSNSTGVLGDTWVLTNANGLGGTPVWTELLAASSSTPPARDEHTAVYDPSTNQMTIFGGETSLTTQVTVNDVWRLIDPNGLPSG